MRSREARELVEAHPRAFLLAYMIAYRAQFREGFNRHSLKIGEAMLGDWKACGMSQQQYRTAKAVLQKHAFATFRVTNRGTIGKLIDTRLFSVSPLAANEQNNSQPTISQRLPRSVEQKISKKEFARKLDCGPQRHAGESAEPTRFSVSVSASKLGKGPTVDEVIEFAESIGPQADCMIEPFFNMNDDRWDEIRDWKKAFAQLVKNRGPLWARRVSRDCQA